MTIHNAQVMTEMNGYVFHCDGGGNGAGAKERVLVGAPPQDTLQNIPLLNTIAVNNAAITLNQSPPKIVTIDQLYAGGPGSLNFYTTEPVPPATKVPGHTVILNWNATPSAPDFRFKFTLVYDGNRNFQTLLCNISANEDLFQSLDYLMPLTIDAADSQDRDIDIYMTLRTGANPYDYALWCNIQTPEFNFSGIAFQFFKNDASGAPDTCW